jgi:hypothetical protein
MNEAGNTKGALMKCPTFDNMEDAMEYQRMTGSGVGVNLIKNAEANYQELIGRPVGIDHGGCLLVRSIEPESEYKYGGKRWGYQYEWKVNKYTFTRNKKATMAAFGLTEAEYDHWVALITF